MIQILTSFEFLFGLIVVLCASNVYFFMQMKKCQKLATTSKLSGLPNERGLMEVLRPLYARFKRGAIKKIIVAVLDVDNFKWLNTILGYRTADVVLNNLGQVLAEGVRDTDIVAHIHGDEFVVVFTDISSEVASGILGRAKERFCTVGSLLKHKHPDIKLSFSFGVASTMESTQSFDSLFDTAERCLKEAKREKDRRQ